MNNLKTFLFTFVATILLGVTSLAASGVPTVSVSPNGGTVKPGTYVDITINTNGGTLSQMQYQWDEEDYVVKTSTNVSVPVPVSAGKHYLYVTAQNTNKERTVGTINNYWVKYTYTVTDSNGNTTDTTSRPTISVSPNGGTVNAGQTVNVTVNTNGGTLSQAQYQWDSNSPTTVKSTSFTTTVPTSNGTHNLYVTAQNTNGNRTTGDVQNFWTKYTFTVGNGSDNGSSNGSAVPTMTVSPAGGTVSAGQTVTITTNTNGGTLAHTQYQWDNNSPVTVNSTSYTTNVPTSNGTHNLYVTAQNTNGNRTSGSVNSYWTKYTFTVGNSSSTGNPTMTVSPAGGNVNAGQSITITTNTNGGTLAHTQYQWDNNNPVTVKSTSYTVTVPTTAGTHNLYVTAQNTDGYRTTGSVDNYWTKYSFTVASSVTGVPSLSINPTPSAGNLTPGQNITVTVNPNGGTVDHIQYQWDNNNPVTVKAANATITAPTTAGAHNLYVTAQNTDGKRTVGDTENYWTKYAFTVANNNGQTGVPTLTLSPSNGNVKPNSDITVTVNPNGGAVDHIQYQWDNNNPVTARTNPLTITVPNTTGTHYLYVTAQNTNGQRTVGDTENYWIKYTFNVTNNATGEIELDPENRSTIEPGDEIKATIHPTNGRIFSYLTYEWTGPESLSGTIYTNPALIPSPEKEGDYRLDIVIVYSDGTKVPYTFYYTVSKDSNGSVPGNTGTINSNVKSLRVQLQNADPDKRRFDVNENSKYYISYYNGTSKDVEKVKIVFDIPNNFKVTDAHGGTVSTSNQTVTWNLGTVKSKAMGYVTVEVKCKEVSGGEKVIKLQAHIKADSTTKDTSTLRNLFYDSSSNITKHHVRYLPDEFVNKFIQGQGLTRGEFAVMMTRVADLGTSYGYNDHYNYPDLSTFHIYYNEIMAATNAGLFIGYEDGTFRPERVITRAEIVTVLVRYFEIDEAEPIWIYFNDVEGHWAQSYIEKAVVEGIVEGYEDTSFRPDRTVSRAEAVALINRCMFRGEPNIGHAAFVSRNPSISWFTDVPTSAWYYKDVLEAAFPHNYTRTDDGNEDIK